MMKKNWLSESTPSILALLFLALTAVVDLYCIMHGVSDSSLAASVISSLNNIMLIIIGYYFGSSLGSRKKDEFIKSNENAAN